MAFGSKKKLRRGYSATNEALQVFLMGSGFIARLIAVLLITLRAMELIRVALEPIVS